MQEELGTKATLYNGLSYSEAKRERDIFTAIGQVATEAAIYGSLFYAATAGLSGEVVATAMVINAGPHAIRLFLRGLAEAEPMEWEDKRAYLRSFVTTLKVNEPYANLPRGRQNLVSLAVGPVRTVPVCAAIIALGMVGVAAEFTVKKVNAGASYLGRALSFSKAQPK